MSGIGSLSSGQPHLDAILGGGLPEHGINLVIGLPGSGKTMLAEQYVFHNASSDHPAIYLTTASEPLEKVVRYGQSLAFFDSSAIGSSIFFEDLGPILDDNGLDAVMERMTAILKERRPGFVVIDSFKALRTFAPDDLAYRRFVMELTGRLSASPINTFWVGEYGRTEVSDAPEFAVADSIISLESRREGNRQLRHLEVLKLRGSGFLSGLHAYRLSSNGLVVFPRLADQRDETGYALDDRRLSTGLPALDAMVGGGIWRGSSTLVAGPAGAGKTLTGLHFLRAGVDAGEGVVLASLQENPSQIERVARGFGWSLDGIDLLHRSPVDMYIDEWVYDLLALVDRVGATRVLIDSLNDLRIASPDDTRFQEYVFSLLQRASRQGPSLMMTYETGSFFGPTVPNTSPISHLADNVYLLQMLMNHSVDRSFTVLKTRATPHAQQPRPFSIGKTGIELEAAEGQAL